MVKLTSLGISKEVSSLIRIESAMKGVTMRDFVEGLVIRHIDAKYPEE